MGDAICDPPEALTRADLLDPATRGTLISMLITRSNVAQTASPASTRSNTPRQTSRSGEVGLLEVVGSPSRRPTVQIIQITPSISQNTQIELLSETGGFQDNGPEPLYFQKPNLPNDNQQNIIQPSISKIRSSSTLQMLLHDASIGVAELSTELTQQSW